MPVQGIKINKIFKPLYTSDKRYFLLSGGRGSLKSTTVHDFIARLTYEAGHGVLFTRYTMSSAELSIIPEFKRTLDKLGITDDFIITKSLVTNKRTKSFIYFSGIKTSSGDQTARLKSISGVTTWVIEEGEDFKDEKAFNDIDDSIRTPGKRNRVIWIQNPTTAEHFIYKMFIAPKNRVINVEGFDVTVSDMDNVEHIHTTYKIAERLGYLSLDWLAKASKFYAETATRVKALQMTWVGTSTALEAEIKRVWHTSHYYFNYIGGWLEKAEGVIFDTWQEGAFDYNLPNCLGLDYGYSPNPLAMVRVAVNQWEMKIYLKEEVYQHNLDDVPTYLKLKGIDRNDLIVADTSEERTTSLIRKAGFNIVEAQKEMIVDDIREMKTYTIIVDPDSPNLKRELNNYKWNDKRASIPIDDYNDGLDASRYGFRRLVGKHKRGKTTR